MNFPAVLIQAQKRTYMRSNLPWDVFRYSLQYEPIHQKAHPHFRYEPSA